MVRALMMGSSTVFKDSLADYMGARYELAISGFQDFLERFPQTPDAPRAQLYIGDSYSALKRSSRL
jgi:TolA-binding protein